jgi:hypothetical protein
LSDVNEISVLLGSITLTIENRACGTSLTLSAMMGTVIMTGKYIVSRNNLLSSHHENEAIFIFTFGTNSFKTVISGSMHSLTAFSEFHLLSCFEISQRKIISD